MRKDVGRSVTLITEEPRGRKEEEEKIQEEKKKEKEYVMVVR